MKVEKKSRGRGSKREVVKLVKKQSVMSLKVKPSYSLIELA